MIANRCFTTKCARRGRKIDFTQTTSGTVWCGSSVSNCVVQSLVRSAIGVQLSARISAHASSRRPDINTVAAAAAAAVLKSGRLQRSSSCPAARWPRWLRCFWYLSALSDSKVRIGPVFYSDSIREFRTRSNTRWAHFFSVISFLSFARLSCPLRPWSQRLFNCLILYTSAEKLVHSIWTKLNCISRTGVCQLQCEQSWWNRPTYVQKSSSIQFSLCTVNKV